MKIAFYTLGCKTNQYETQGLERLFAQNDYEIVDFNSFADVYVVNTCTVTALGDKKSRIVAHKAKKLNPNAVLAVCGCYSQIKPHEVRALCGADIVVGSANKGALVPLVAQALAGKLVDVTPQSADAPFEILPSGGLYGRTRAMLKVQDGCQNYCAYCIIPYARGKCRSLPLDAAATEAAALASSGYCEVVVTGIEISSYGVDLAPTQDLAHLISAVCAAAPATRIRLGSLEPRTITEDFCTQISALPNLCPHFHLSLQSGCDKTLKSMNRRYDTERFYTSCQLLRSFFPNCSITTDLIVGFPGESDEDFAQTLTFLQKCNFNDVHVFPYSKRVGTSAAKMNGHLPKAVKESRAKQATALCHNMKTAHLQEQIGSVKQVLFEHSDTQQFPGHSPDYYLIRASGEKLQNTIRSVKITAATQGFLLGELLP